MDLETRPGALDDGLLSIDMLLPSWWGKNRHGVGYVVIGGVLKLSVDATILNDD
jgi:hypothetical protein